MPRKSQTLQEDRATIKRRYKNSTNDGSKIKKTSNESDLDPQTIQFKKLQVAFLRASDFPVHYISDNVRVSGGLIRKWLKEEEVQAHIEDVRSEILDGAVNYMKTYAIEAVEGIAEIARHCGEAKVALQAWTELLDRVGVTKVNKSESYVTKDEQVSLNADDLMDQLEALPLETQHRIAEMSEQIQQMIEEAKGAE